MNAVPQFRLSGVARSDDALKIVDEFCEHFIEHAEVQRTDVLALLNSPLGTASIRIERQRLLIDLDCPSESALQMSRTSIAEHLFYFAGEAPFDLTWSEPVPLSPLPNIHHVTVVSAEDVTPHMRRVKFSCADVSPFVGADMHVRLLVPPKGRPLVLPGHRDDGRVKWPEGADELLVRVYTIRAADVERQELWIDFLQHPAPGVQTPGADFGRDAQPGDKAALLGPGGGGLPAAEHILMIGDESALPAIARIAAEAPAGTRIEAIIEVEDEAEQQALAGSASLEVRWLHRRRYPQSATGVLVEQALKSIDLAGNEAFVWVACEKEDVRRIRAHLRSRGHSRKNSYAAWYWELAAD